MKNQVFDDKIPWDENNNGDPHNMGRRESFDSTIAGIRQRSPSLQEDIKQASDPTYDTNDNSRR